MHSSLPSVRWSWRASLVVGAVLIAFIGAREAGAQRPAWPTVPPREVPRTEIDQANRMLLVQAMVTGKSQAIVLVLAKAGHITEAVREATALGMELQARFDEVGYFRARAPLAAFDRLRRSPYVVEAILEPRDLSFQWSLDLDPGRPKANPAIGLPPRSPDTRPLLPASAVTALSAYAPTADFGAAQFIAAHPTFDGRGVTIANTEVGDFGHPSLRVARSLNGDTIPKVAGVLDPSAYDPPSEPRTDVFGPRGSEPRTHINRAATIQTGTDGTFIFEGERYRAPKPGGYAVGSYRRRDGSVVVAWDTAARRVWVDTDGDGDLGDEAVLTDINTAFSAGQWPPDSATPSGASFAVTFDSAGGGLRLYEGADWHGTATASVAAAHDLLGGAAHGAGPGARVLYFNNPGTVSGLIEGFIRAVRDPRVDVVTTQTIGESSFAGAGEGLLSLVLNRLVAVYGKPILSGAGNSGPIAQGIQEPGGETGVLTVGAYISRDTYAASFGWRVPDADNLAFYSARGPTVLGALKPDVVIANSGIAAAPIEESSSSPDYRLPAGYGNFGGTSAASPAAAGAVALLISAAKQSGVRHDAHRLMWALRTSARFLSGYQVHEQGNGLVDVPKAWDLLRRAAAGEVDPPVIETSAPVHSALDRYLRTPGRGVGLYEREGWTVGKHGTRHITLTRRSGGREPVTYDLRWLGNDDTFAAARTVTLPLDRPVTIEVGIQPKAPGIHSAALELVDRRSGLPVHRVLTAVVAPHRLRPETGSVVRDSAVVAWFRSRSYFIDVPPGVPALRLRLRVSTGRLSFSVKAPDAPRDERVLVSRSFADLPVRSPGVAAGDSGTLLIPNPQPGVWEVALGHGEWLGSIGGYLTENEERRYHVDAEYALEVAAVGGTVQVGAATVTMGKAATVTVRNGPARLSGGAVIGALGTQRRIPGRLTSAKPTAVHDIGVNSGATSLTVDLGIAAAAVADLYVYHCAGEDACRLWDVGLATSAKTIVVREPAPGTWRVVVDGMPPFRGRTAYVLQTIMAHPRLGRVELRDGPAARAGGVEWAVQAVVHPGMNRDAGVTASGAAESALVAVFELVDQGAESAERLFAERAWWNEPNRPITLGRAVVRVDRAAR